MYRKTHRDNQYMKATILVILLVVTISYFIPSTQEEVAYKKGDRPLYAVTLSGGGWRAQAAAWGFTKALHSSKIPIDIMSSNSGGSWFLTQYDFSSKFQKSVDDPNLTAEEGYTAWLQTFVNQTLQTEAAAIDPDKHLAQLFQKMNMDSALTCVEAVLKSGVNWETMISDMLSGYDPAIRDRLASVENRVGNKTHTSIITMAVPTTGMYFSEGDEVRSIQAKGWFAPPLPSVLPLGWRTDPSKGAQEWFSPQYNLNECTSPDNRPRCEWQVATKRGWMAEGRGEASVSVHLESLPSVTKIASASSAAASAVDWPDVIKTIVDDILGDMMPEWMEVLFQGFVTSMSKAVGSLFGNLAVCSLSENDTCGEGAIKLVDGVYTDDSGIWAAIATAQHQQPGERVIKLYVLDSNTCEQANADACSSVGNWEDLFDGRSKHDGYMSVLLPLQYKVPSTAIFRGSMPSYSRRLTGQDDKIASRFRYTQHTLYTIDNPVYGIKGGWKVDVTALHINSLLPTCLSGSTPDAYNAYSKLAQAVYTFYDVAKYDE